MKASAFILLTILLFAGYASAQDQHALIIAINTYQPPPGTAIAGDGRAEFTDLQGCRNDALVIKSLLQTRFNFPEKNITELYDEKATRDAMLSSIRDLLHDCKSEDIAFIYYAGHGSQQRNSRSREADKKDESIVPCDTWKKGVVDIRDKEFAALCNTFLDKGVKLTVILDCCHSGSMSRGITYVRPSYRYLPENNQDANDASSPPPPEERKDGNFMIMSASQDNEFAEEQPDNNHIIHGAFTLALSSALLLQNNDATALNIFSSTRAILKSNGKMQEPVLGASPQRQQETLFGIAKNRLPAKTVFPVAGVKNNKIEFQAGFAQNLYTGCELIFPADSLIVAVDTVLGINRCLANVLKGDIRIVKPGMLFEEYAWISSPASLLTIYTPPGLFSYDQVSKELALAKQLKRSGKVNWITNLEKYDPDIFADVKADSVVVNVKGKSVIKKAGFENLLQTMKGRSVFLNLLPGEDLIKKIRHKFAAGGGIRLTDDPREAQYFVYGMLGPDNKLGFGLMRSQPAARDSLESMPLQTVCFPAGDRSAGSEEKIADSIYVYACRLAKVRSWLNLQGPRGSQFPFHIELVNEATGQQLTNMVCKIHDHISFHLAANPDNEGYYIAPKFVYVFAIDRNGQMILAYPDASDGNVENKFPKFDNGNMLRDVELFSYTATEPVGTDNVYVIACSDPITDYAMLFNQAGVTAITTRGESNPLAALLNMGNGNTAMSVKSLPNWKLIRLAVKTTH